MKQMRQMALHQKLGKLSLSRNFHHKLAQLQPFKSFLLEFLKHRVTKISLKSTRKVAVHLERIRKEILRKKLC